MNQFYHYIVLSPFSFYHFHFSFFLFHFSFFNFLIFFSTVKFIFFYAGTRTPAGDGI